MVVGIMVGSGIFRTPGVVAGLLGRPALTFVAWALGGLVGLLGALVFAELATRHPSAGGKYVFPLDIDERLEDRERTLLARFERMRDLHERTRALAAEIDEDEVRA